MPDTNRPSQKIFFERALREAQRYGEDPWVLLRELVQNSRDADASNIRFSTVRTDDQEMLVCLDDGSGMDTADFERYLLRLYASSKESEAQAVGFFGVGFWSTLLFQPTEIRVLSRKGGKTQGLLVDCRACTVRDVVGELEQDGTEIQLRRPRSEVSDAAFSSEVRERLIYYVGHVRGRRPRQRLNLFFEGEQLDRKFEAPPIMGRRVQQGSTDGVVGFAPDPSVRIYKGGILVRDLASLSELLPNRISSLDSDWGFYPYIRLNIEGLQVLMDRQSVFEDPELEQAVSLVEATLLELHENLVSRLFPLPWRQRLANHVKAYWQRWLILTLIISVSVIAGFVVRFQTSSVSQGGNDPRFGQALPQQLPTPDIEQAGGNGDIALVDEAFRNWQGSGIDSPEASPDYRWFFAYNSSQPKLFTLRIMDRYDPRIGFVPSPHERVGIYPRVISSQQDALRIRAGVRGGQLFALPLPPGFALLANSVRDSRGNLITPQMNQFGQPIVFVSTPQVIEFQAVPTELPPPPQQFGQVRLPPEMEDFLLDIRTLDPEEQMERCTNFVETHFRYSDSAELARQLREGNGDWLARSWQLGAGDCDVLNGIYVLLLRNLGIHARLEAGLVGSYGRAFSDMHAWAAIYHNQRWYYSDLSNGVNVDALTSSDNSPLPPSVNPESLNSNFFPSSSRTPYPEDVELPQKPLPQPVNSSPGMLSPLWLLWFLLIPIGWVLLRLRGKVPALQEGAYLRELFQHHFRFGAAGDPLQLRQRFIFPSLEGSLLSIRDLETAASDHGLFLATFENALIEKLEPEALVLRSDAAVIQALSEFLPPMTPLDEVDHLLKSDQKLPPLLQQLQTQLQAHDTQLRLHLQGDSKRIRELTLPLKAEHAKLGRHHLILGADHPLVSIYPLDRELPAQERFFLLRQLLRHSTFYLNDADRLLAEAAEQAFAGEAGS